ncbi:MAG TPA: polysaccharide biosynthesis/export family protein [Candidatus Synoicihabitans sp.]|nr:polysaccharide biosynthesis/export family protein [Candidatus Synoicihabitans sp.]
MRTRLFSLAVAVVGLVGLSGCHSPQVSMPPPASAMAADASTHALREGDVVKLSFPSAPNLDATYKVGRDGKISPSLVGELKAAGLTPLELENKLRELYATELLSSEVFVSVVSSSYPIFVTGAVVRPGKIEVDRPMTALEAIMEAGGFQMAKANGGAVVIVRQEQGQVRNYTLDLRKVLEGQSSETFFLQPSDIVYVPERFAWF